eukprot:TRINITY_DN22792_c0_g1_i1.p1 TRINITY_DN22792_c0_g1~~TRINITY_DN22792_c0_g1_i1.p1  ORF type:complete len:474 (-),score=122.99 TRINITY_DN22792_c0_g1_i1:478-1899(-)
MALAAMETGGQAVDAGALEAAFAGLTDDELRRLGERAGTASAQLQNSLAELQAEKADLEAEKAELNTAIELMLSDMKKLNIGADNLSDPVLDEGPVEFVGRIWEQIRPRDTAVHVSEHVGEIIKPTPDCETNLARAAANRFQAQFAEGLDSFSSAIEQANATSALDVGRQVADRGQELSAEATKRGHELAEQVTEKGQELSKHVGDRFSLLYSSIEETVAPLSSDVSLPDYREQIAKHGQELNRKLSGRFSEAMNFFNQEPSDDVEEQEDKAPSFGSLFSYLRGAATLQPKVGPDSRGPGLPDDEQELAGAAALRVDRGGVGGMSGIVTGGGSGSSTGAGSDSEPKVASEEGVSRETSGEDPAVDANGCRSHMEAHDVAQQPSEEKERELATLMIEARLTLGDGSEIMVAEVRAQDRVKDVAKRFVQEHSLKALYEAPLASYLMDEESKAERFPVRLEADLNAIRKQYSSGNI